MKKIFVIEINEKDINIQNEEVVNSLDKQLQEISEMFVENKNLYVKLKRVGSTWQNIIENIKIISKNNIKNEKFSSAKKKTNHLKIVK
jgi:hypothetical protein